MFCGLEGALQRGEQVPSSQRLRCTQTTSMSPGGDTSLGDRLLFGLFHKGLWCTESSCQCSQVSVAHLKIKIICVWRAPQPLRCLSSQLRQTGEGGVLLFISGSRTSMTEMQSPWLTSWTLLSLLIDNSCLLFGSWRNASLSRLEFCQGLIFFFFFAKKFYMSNIPTPWILWS